MGEIVKINTELSTQDEQDVSKLMLLFPQLREQNSNGEYVFLAPLLAAIYRCRRRGQDPVTDVTLLPFHGQGGPSVAVHVPLDVLRDRVRAGNPDVLTITDGDLIVSIPGAKGNTRVKGCVPPKGADVVGAVASVIFRVKGPNGENLSVDYHVSRAMFAGQWARWCKTGDPYYMLAKCAVAKACKSVAPPESGLSDVCIPEETEGLRGWGPTVDQALEIADEIAGEPKKEETQEVAEADNERREPGEDREVLEADQDVDVEHAPSEIKQIPEPPGPTVTVADRLFGGNK